MVLHNLSHPSYLLPSPTISSCPHVPTYTLAPTRLQAFPDSCPSLLLPYPLAPLLVSTPPMLSLPTLQGYAQHSARHEASSVSLENVDV